MKNIKSWPLFAAVYAMVAVAVLVLGGAGSVEPDSSRLSTPFDHGYEAFESFAEYESSLQIRESDPPWPWMRKGSFGYGQFIDFDDDDQLDTSKWTFTVTNDTALTAADHVESGAMTFASFGTADNYSPEATQDVV